MTATRLPAAWATHINDTLTDWLGDLNLNGQSAANLISYVTSTHPTLPGHIDWVSPTATGIYPDGSGSRDVALAMLDNPWHAGWGDVSEILVTAAGQWLHPESCYTLGDGYAIATMRAGLCIGCVDTTNPAAGRPRYRIDRDPFSNDLGVVVFPLRPHWVVDAVADGCSPAQAAQVAFGLAVVEASVHEALELFQSEPGVAVVNPHTVDGLMPVAVRIPGLPGREVFP